MEEPNNEADSGGEYMTEFFNDFTPATLNEPVTAPATTSPSPKPKQSKKRNTKKIVDTNSATRSDTHEWTKRAKEREAELLQHESQLVINGADNEDIKVSNALRVLNTAERDPNKLVYLPNKLAVLLKPHQLDGLRFAWNHIVSPPKDNLKGCILAHSMGLGKTFITVTFVYMFMQQNYGKSILIACPKVVIRNWRNEFNKWLPMCGLNRVTCYCMDDSTKSKDREWTVKKWKNDGGILIISYELYSILVGMRGSTTTEKGESAIDMLTGQSYTPVARKKSKKPKVDEFHERMRDWLFSPDLVVIDEGTKIKNADTNFSKALNSIQTRNRMILTGTPLQNHLMEYYSMVNWVRPDYWTKDEFKRLFVTPIRDGMKADDDPFAVNVMKQRSYVLVEELKNFVDRKDQSILVRDLPQKKEYVVYFKLTKFQKRIYKLFLNAVTTVKYKSNILYLSAILHKVVNHPDLLLKYLQTRGVKLQQPSLYNGNDTKRQKISPNKSIGSWEEPIDIDLDDDYDYLDIGSSQPQTTDNSKKRRRKIESMEDVDPDDLGDAPFDDDDDNSWAQPILDPNYQQGVPTRSAKMNFLLQMIEKCYQMHEKILVFSQYTETLDVIEQVFDKNPLKLDHNRALKAGNDYFRLDGTVTSSKRQNMIDEFNHPECDSFVFLISTRAGGLGITLTAATRVIVFDVNWDPAWDQQAIFRAWRYGQTKPVFVYRLVMSGTVEENMWKRCIAKIWLQKRIVDNEAPTRILTSADMNLFDSSGIDSQSSSVLDSNVYRNDEALCALLGTEFKEENKIKPEMKREDNLLFDESIVHKQPEVINLDDDDEDESAPVANKNPSVSIQKEEPKSILDKVIIMIDDSDDEEEDDENETDLSKKVKNVLLHESLYLEDSRDKLDPRDQAQSVQEYKAQRKIIKHGRTSNYLDEKPLEPSIYRPNYNHMTPSPHPSVNHDLLEAQRHLQGEQRALNQMTMQQYQRNLMPRNVEREYLEQQRQYQLGLLLQRQNNAAMLSQYNGEQQRQLLRQPQQLTQQQMQQIEHKRMQRQIEEQKKEEDQKRQQIQQQQAMERQQQEQQKLLQVQQQFQQQQEAQLQQMRMQQRPQIQHVQPVVQQQAFNHQPNGNQRSMHQQPYVLPNMPPSLVNMWSDLSPQMQQQMFDRHLKMLDEQ